MSYIGAKTAGVIANVDGGTISNATLDSTVTFPAGTVIQVIQKEFGSRYSHSGGGSGVWVAVSGFTQSITPASTSNKILVILHTSFANSNTLEHTSIRIKRDSTVLGNHVSPSNRSLGLIAHQTIGTSNNAPYAGGLFLDSPNTTSSITYSVEAYTASATFYMNYNSADSDSSHYVQGISTLTLMEIQG